MATFSLREFGGMIPLLGNQKRPIGIAEIAENANLESRDLMPILGSSLAAAAPSGTPKSAYRIPATLRGDIADPPPSSIPSADDLWVWFDAAYSHLQQSPVTNDQFNRWYWTEEGQRPKYAPFGGLRDGTEFFLGMPRPPDAPTVTPAVVRRELPLTFFDPADAAIFPSTPGYVDIAYFRQFLVEGGLPPYVYEVTSGSLPPSITLSEVRGTLAGVPSAAGTYNFTVRVTDDAGASVSRAVQVVILASPYVNIPDTDPLVQRVVPPPAGIDEVYYTHNFAAEGGSSPRSFRVTRGALPPGLILTSQGVLYGRPTAPGVFGFTLEAFDATGQASKLDYELTVVNAPFTPPQDELFVTRCYVYTYVSDFGEESAPSPPTCVEGAEGEDWSLILPTSFLPEDIPVFDQGHFNTKRIYRTVTGQTGGSFFFVDEIPVGDTLYTDSKPTDEVSLGDILESDTWEPPPEELVGLSRHPNGWFVGYTAADSTLHFSEPYRPHAWPAQYDITVGGRIQGITVSGGQMVVLTDVAPYVLAGPVPAALTLRRSDTSEPCVSRWGIVSTPRGVLFPSKNGIVATDGRDVQIATSGLLSRLDWREYDPEGLYMARHQDRMVGIPLSGKAFLLDPTEPNAMFTELFGFGSEDDPVPDSLRTDPYSQEAYWVQDGRAFWFDHNAADPVDFIWTSGRFNTARPLNWGVFSIDVVPYRGAPVNLSVFLFSIDADGTPVLRHSVTVLAGDTYRLPLGFKDSTWQVAFVGTGRVQSFTLAETALELASV
jgi:hypothetical protein